MSKRQLDVVAALIKEKDRFLLCQRADDDHYGSLWEFPGGTVEEDEILPRALEREIKEELALDITASEELAQFTDENDSLIIKVFLFSCRIKAGAPQARECKDFGFFTLVEIERLDLAPVDRKMFNYLKSSR